MSYTQLLYHIIIRTKSNRYTLSLEHSEELYRYIWGYVKNKHSVLFRINGIEDHIHLFLSMTPTVSVSDFIRDLKAESSKMLKRTFGFENFEGWSEGYAALSCSLNDKDKIINYINSQREHHKHISFKEEYEEYLKQMGLKLDERDWER